MSEHATATYGKTEAKRRKMLARAEARKEQAVRHKLRRVDQRQAVRSKFSEKYKAFCSRKEAQAIRQGGGYEGTQYSFRKFRPKSDTAPVVRILGQTTETILKDSGVPREQHVLSLLRNEGFKPCVVEDNGPSPPRVVGFVEIHILSSVASSKTHAEVKALVLVSACELVPKVDHDTTAYASASDAMEPVGALRQAHLL